jgi:hypothetical protein
MAHTTETTGQYLTRLKLEIRELKQQRDSLLAMCKEALHDLMLSDLEQDEIDHIKMGLREAVIKIEGQAPPICHACDSVIPSNEPVRVDEDGDLCQDCYARLYGERDREDERWQWGDIQHDRSRGN